MINKYIDHTLLKADASYEDIKKIIDEAKKYEFKSVCINSSYVKFAKELLKDSDVNICTVVGFPLGASNSKTKAFEAKTAIEDGADEIDMVINIGYLKSKKYDEVLDDIRQVREASKGHILKVIIETSLLTEQEKIKACEISKQAKADFVKTSTGFSTAGAKKEDVKLMKEVVKDELEVKASGGIHSYKEAMEMIENGASRLGCSKSIDIINEER
ncbi:MAG: deoxyribose-phosphate aldolase [Tissierellia bacterium]|nr:deoxyribose-phosphate aldolase [Tissierellia bacterium]